MVRILPMICLPDFWIEIRIITSRNNLDPFGFVIFGIRMPQKELYCHCIFSQPKTKLYSLLSAMQFQPHFNQHCSAGIRLIKGERKIHLNGLKNTIKESNKTI